MPSYTHTSGCYKDEIHGAFWAIPPAFLCINQGCAAATVKPAWLIDFGESGQPESGFYLPPRMAQSAEQQRADRCCQQIM